MIELMLHKVLMLISQLHINNVTFVTIKILR